MLKNIYSNLMNDSENRQRIVMATILIVIAIIITVFNSFASKNVKKDNNVEFKFKSYAATYYEQGFYEAFLDSELKGDTNLLSKYENDGIKIYAEEVFNGVNLNPNTYFRNEEKDYACSLNTSLAKIYPKAPYGKKDYSIEVVVDC